MFKWALVALLLRVGFPLFPEQVSQESSEVNLHNESLALIYLARGNENLLSKHILLALDDFNKASLLLEEIQERNIELDFLVCFGKVIAFDNLGMQTECQNALASLFFIIEDEDEEDVDDSDGLGDLLSPEYADADAVLRQLANVARSPKVRDLLFSLIDKMSEQVEPLFKFADPAAINHLDWQYDHNSDSSLNLCKSHFWKKLEKMARKTYRVVMKAKQVWEFLKELEEKLG